VVQRPRPLEKMVGPVAGPPGGSSRHPNAPEPDGSGRSPAGINCRFCRASLRVVFADLGMTPLANRFLSESDLGRMEPFYPLRAYACESCFLVQLEAFECPQAIFGEYAYFSSYSTTWLEHARAFAVEATRRAGLGPQSLVLEIASNDGYLLRWFRELGIRVLGIEPARNVAQAAIEAGIPTRVEFFGARAARRLAEAGERADLVVGNNVLAHVPDIRDFIEGLALVVKPEGRISLEFPHLLNLIEQTQYDTIYHEHFSYLSLLTVDRMFETMGLRIVDVEELPTHGGSLRVWAARAAPAGAPAPRVEALLRREREAGLEEIATYERFGEAVVASKRDLLEFLIARKREGSSIAAYGAPAKGNTLLNYCGIRGDFIEYTVDRSPHKQGRFLPGTHIPVHPVERIAQTKPEYVLILPWNLRVEIIEQMRCVREWGGRFVTPIPRVAVHP
jgi:SAM-dependent methyltransferase